MHEVPGVFACKDFLSTKNIWATKWAASLWLCGFVVFYAVSFPSSAYFTFLPVISPFAVTALAFLFVILFLGYNDAAGKQKKLLSFTKQGCCTSFFQGFY